MVRLPSIALRLPWNTIFDYGLIDHQIIRDFAIVFLKTAHPDKKDITFRELDKDVIITATN